MQCTGAWNGTTAAECKIPKTRSVSRTVALLSDIDLIDVLTSLSIERIVLADMRKPCSLDKDRKNFRTNGREIRVTPEECFS